MSAALPSIPDKRRATAFHEAGHRVIANRLGFLGDTVTIRPVPGTLGSSLSADAPPDGSRDEDAVAVLFAGLVAARLVRPQATVEDGAWDDYEKAAELLVCPRPANAAGLRSTEGLALRVGGR